jgi:hypothetical protein
VLLKIKTALIFVLTAASLTFAAPGAQESDEWELVAKLCGRLEHVDHLPDKKNPILYLEKHSPIAAANLLAYERSGNSTCCRNTPVIAETKPDKSGNFEFKGLPFGSYWFVVLVDQKQYMLPVLVKKTEEKLAVCSEMSFAIEDTGKFSLRVRAPGR